MDLLLKREAVGGQPVYKVMMLIGRAVIVVFLLGIMALICLGFSELGDVTFLEAVAGGAAGYIAADLWQDLGGD